MICQFTLDFDLGMERVYSMLNAIDSVLNLALGALLIGTAAAMGGGGCPKKCLKPCPVCPAAPADTDPQTGLCGWADSHKALFGILGVLVFVLLVFVVDYGVRRCLRKAPAEAPADELEAPLNGGE